MISKVNRPSFLRLIKGSGAPKNDPGSSQGGGNAYEQQPDLSRSQVPSLSKQEAMPTAEQSLEHSSKIIASDQIGLTEVVLEFRDQQKNTSAPAPGLNARYHDAGATARGLLLNRKVE